MSSTESLLQSRVISHQRARDAGRRADSAPSTGSEGAPSPDPVATPSSTFPALDGQGDSIQKQFLLNKLFPGKHAPLKIGRFLVLEQIGQGGMGTVYACYDDQLDRKVAVKILLSKLSTAEQGRARLLREAQAMARLSHPNIVTVLEVGAVDEQVYLAMEFLRGQTLDVWIAESPRSWVEIVDAFIQAGRGLAAAHRAGIIHRDFKPPNVLLTKDGLVKVLDFGLAKATDAARYEDLLASVPEGTEDSRTLLQPLTRTGALLGTPAYMSPEQHHGEPVTAASDQFSFCVALYLSLFGHFPFSTTSLDALRRDVANGVVAPMPTRTRVPGRVFKALRRGMAADPARRFPSMTALLTELTRDPAALPRRLAITTAVAGVVGVSSFAAAGLFAPALPESCPDAQAELASIWNPTRARAVESAIRATGLPYAAESWTTVEPQLTRFATAWGAMRNEACQTHAEERQSDQLFDLRTACLDQRRASFAGLVDILAATDKATLDSAVQAVGRLPSLANCADSEALTAAIAPPESPAARAQVQDLRERLARAQVEEHAGRYAPGLQVADEVVTEARSLGYKPLLAEALLRKGSLQAAAGADQAAAETLGLALLSGVTAQHTTVVAQASSKQLWVRGHRLGRPAQALEQAPLATAFNQLVERDDELYPEFLDNLGYVQFVAKDLPEAHRSLLAALARLEGGGRGESALALKVLSDLAYLTMDGLDDYKEALGFSRRAVALSKSLHGEHHPAHLRHATTLANILLAAGRPVEARALLRPFERDLDKIADVRLQAYVLILLGFVARDERDLAAARRYFGAALQLAPEHSEESLAATLELGQLLARMGGVDDEAAIRTYFDDILVSVERRFGPGDFRNGLARRYYSQALCAIGRTDAVEQQLAEHLRAAGASGATERDLGLERARLRTLLGVEYHELGDLDAAQQQLTQALADLERLGRTQVPDGAAVLHHLGEIAASRGRFDEAVALLRRAEAVYAALAEPDYGPLALTRFALARALTGAAAVAPAEARALAVASVAVLRAKGPAFAPELRATEPWMTAHIGP